MKKYLLLLFSCLFILNCSSFNKNKTLVDQNNNPERASFLKGQSLALTGEYEKAIPYLQATAQKRNSDEDQALILLARCNDQMSQPEKVISILTDLLVKTLDPVTELKARTLLVKNQTKANLESQKSADFKALRSLINMANDDKVLVLENLRWAMDFSCDQYCLAEVTFLQKIQTEYLYIIETDERASSRAASILEDKYSFFVGFLDKDFLNSEFKKRLMLTLIKSLEKFKSMQPPAVTTYLQTKADSIAATTDNNEVTGPGEQKQTDIPDSELSTQVKIFSNLNDLRKRLVTRYDSIKSTK